LAAFGFVRKSVVAVKRVSGTALSHLPSVGGVDFFLVDAG
jgi:hypothetical protein